MENNSIRALEVLAKETGGSSFKTKRFCYEDFQTPASSFLMEQPEYHIIPKDTGETERLKTYKSLIDYVDQIRTAQTEPLFHFFLDGSRRTYKVGDTCYSKRVYPIVAGQIAVGCCQRVNKDLVVKEFDSRIVIVLPNCANANRDNTFWSKLKTKVNNTSSIHTKYKLKFSDILYYKDKEGEDYEDLAVAQIQDLMMECEKEMVAKLTKDFCLSDPKRLIKDGSLEYRTIKSNSSSRELSKIRNNYRWVVGVSKRFNPEMCKDLQGRTIAPAIADLPLYCRTPAFKYESSRARGSDGSRVYFSVWYVRIRDAKYTQSPFDGVVKVEKVLCTDDETGNGLKTDEVDAITAHLITERNPVCYGADSRWANHLYPVYLTESYVKSRYISNQYLMNAL